VNQSLKKRARTFMPLNVKCPKCGKILKARENLAGKRVKCPQCAAVMTVPDPPNDEPAVILAQPTEPTGRAKEDELSEFLAGLPQRTEVPCSGAVTSRQSHPANDSCGNRGNAYVIIAWTVAIAISLLSTLLFRLPSLQRDFSRLNEIAADDLAVEHPGMRTAPEPAFAAGGAEPAYPQQKSWLLSLLSVTDSPLEELPIVPTRGEAALMHVKKFGTAWLVVGLPTLCLTIVVFIVLRKAPVPVGSCPT